MNVISVTGRLTADVELKQTQNGTSVCSFTLAVQRPKVSDTTDFLNFVAWRNQAEFIWKYFKKGDMIAITGALTSRKFTDREGANRTAFEILVDTADFCGGKRDDSAQANTTVTQEKPSASALPFDNEPLPF
jgi:single-strand DNA-binding protein